MSVDEAVLPPFFICVSGSGVDCDRPFGPTATGKHIAHLSVAGLKPTHILHFHIALGKANFAVAANALLTSRVDPDPRVESGF